MPEIDGNINKNLNYASLCQSAYDGKPDFQGLNKNARAYLGTVNGFPTICFPGSKTGLDWFYDLLAIPALELDSFAHIKLGLMPLGFLTAVNDIRQYIKLPEGNYNICGHSLGGVMATIYAALQTIDGRPPTEVVTFDAPRGLSPLGEYALKKIAVRQYRFGLDVVSLVPTHPYVHAREPLIQVGNPIISADLVRDNHKIQNFIDLWSGKDES